MSTIIATPSRFFQYLFLPLATAVFLIWPSTAAASPDRPLAQVVVLKQALTNWEIFGGVFSGGASVAAGDVNGDGQEEIVVGAGQGGGPHLEIYRLDGQRIASFFAFLPTMRQGISLAVGDLDGDEIDEIVVAPRGDYAPEIQIYDYRGQRRRSIFAYDLTYRLGLEVAVLPAKDNNSGLILTCGGYQGREIKAFSPTGAVQFTAWYPHGQQAGDRLGLAAMHSPTFSEPVLVTGAGNGHKPLVLIHGLRTGRLLASWLAYDPRVTTGLSIAARDGLVITGPGYRGGPEVRIFNSRGRLQQTRYAMATDYIGGIEVGIVSTAQGLTPLAAPLGKPRTGQFTTATDKEIVVDLSDQLMYLYEYGQLIKSHRVSSGQASMPTPSGTFHVKNKIPVAYSRRYDLYMEYWMAFSPNGDYGLHALPYWATRSGKLYEGASHLGTPVSHGCVRQSLADAAFTYNWASVGTKITIQP